MQSSHSINESKTTIESMIDQLRQTKTDQARKKLIANLDVNMVDVELYHHFGVNSYGRNLVFSNADFEVILMCWQPNQHSVAHDHNGSLCVMKCIAGELNEQRYVKQLDSNTTDFSLVDSKIIPSVNNQLTAGGLSSITDQEGLHSISNSSEQAACSLHFYFPPINRTNVYCLKDGSQKNVGSIFTSEYGVKIP